jgi:hypothetical protein
MTRRSAERLRGCNTPWGLDAGRLSAGRALIHCDVDEASVWAGGLGR